MPFNNNENKIRKPRSRRAMNLVVAGAVAAAPALGCGTTKPKADAAPNMDATGAVDKAETGAEHSAMDGAAPDSGGKDTAMDAAAVDLVATSDGAKDGGADDALDAYPDGVRG
jgi:hypothetical protein